MNLPLKLVDLVTLLFCSLLVVIIVFIILQRNIKRLRLRNFKDSHYLKCKSFPQDLRDAIEKKHIISNCYKEAPNLLAESHLRVTDDKTKTYVLRMKAFEVSKNLENALAECGYIRAMSKKFENFINDDLINQECDDKALPKTLLNDFVDLYLWAMHDPMPFDCKRLRKLNQLINKIITILAFNKTEKHDQIIQHKLDLDPLGDVNFHQIFAAQSQKSARSYSNLTSNMNSENLNIFEKRKLSRMHKNNSNNTDNQAVGENGHETINLEEFKDIKKKPKVTKNASTKSKNTLFKSKGAKYEEIKDTSVQSENSFPGFMRKSKQNLNDTTDSQTNNDWLLTQDRNFDSENEEIPLVSTKKTSTHQKKKSNLSNILIGAPSKSSSIANKSSPSNSIRLSKVTSNPSGNLQIDCGGNENEGFNETIFD